jgi:hypothetical protein
MNSRSTVPGRKEACGTRMNKPVERETSGPPPMACSQLPNARSSRAEHTPRRYRVNHSKAVRDQQDAGLIERVLGQCIALRNTMNAPVTMRNQATISDHPSVSSGSPPGLWILPRRIGVHLESTSATDDHEYSDSSRHDDL